jgi:hypothetical protein
LVRVVFYGLFVFVAAPVDLWLDFVAGVRTQNWPLAGRPIAHALLYIYAFVLAAETLFRVATHQAVLQRKRHLWVPVAGAIVVSGFFVFDYVNWIRPAINNGQEVTSTLPTQIAIAIVALLSSVLSYHWVERSNGGRSRKKT